MKPVVIAGCVLLLLAGGLAAGVVIWRGASGTTNTTSGTAGGGDVYTSANSAADCRAQASAFTDYPLVWAGPSVLGYALVNCAHMMTKTRHDGQGRVSHPGGDAWHFSYGTCVTPPGRESCPVPISIVIDPCAGVIDGVIIPGTLHAPTTTVRGAPASISLSGVLSFEQSSRQITIYTETAPYEPATGQGVEAFVAEKAATAIRVAEALMPANGLASAAGAAAPRSDTLLTETLKTTTVACP